MPLKAVWVYDLARDAEYVFLGIEPEEALVTLGILETHGASQLHNPALRRRYRASLVRGERTVAWRDRFAAKRT